MFALIWWVCLSRLVAVSQVIPDQLRRVCKLVVTKRQSAQHTKKMCCYVLSGLNVALFGGSNNILL